MHNNLSYTEAIREATLQSMELDRNIFVMGLGVSYQNGADGTTKGLKEKFPDRILDTPVSEACITGAGVGAAVRGMRPIIHHGRVEFALFAIDQIVTQAAKWNYMFGGGNPVPIVFRIAVGRQWGNGPQHTQAMYSLFGSVPGLKVVIPSRPSSAKGLLASALRDQNPVVYLEPRWLYGTRESVSTALYYQDLSRAAIVREGSDLTVVTYGDGVVEAVRAARVLAERNVSVEIIDLVSLQPIDYETVFRSIRKTGRLVTFDTTQSAFCVGSEIISKCCQQELKAFKTAPISIACPNVPCPTSTALTADFYPTRIDLLRQAQMAMGHSPTASEPLAFEDLHLSPKFDFTKNE
jgi:acetoin:2,6-dichlorophenolindophenol oxidoreductase subunit beta